MRAELDQFPVRVDVGGEHHERCRLVAHQGSAWVISETGDLIAEASETEWVREGSVWRVTGDGVDWTGSRGKRGCSCRGAKSMRAAQELLAQL